jgi:hypothetical protein
MHRGVRGKIVGMGAGDGTQARENRLLVGADGPSEDVGAAHKGANINVGGRGGGTCWPSPQPGPRWPRYPFGHGRQRGDGPGLLGPA